MPTYNSRQRDAITQFCNFTQAKESVAARLLKNTNWDIEQAVNLHFSGQSSSGPSPIQQNIKKIFDTYREDPSNEPDMINMEGSMKYLNDLGVDLEDATVMAVFELLEPPSMGEFNRENFEAGWTRVSTPTSPCDSVANQAKYISSLRQRLGSDPAYFKQVYKAAFRYAKPANQRAVPVDDAFAYWDMFFRPGHGGIEWNSSTTRWMDLWTEFYRSKVNRPVNKDLWNQFIALVEKTKEADGESLDWWTEDGAWPTAIDDFVAFVKEKRKQQGTMDTT